MTRGQGILTGAAFWLSLGGVLLAFLWHISIGAKAIPIGTVWDAFTAFRDDEFDHMVVRNFRLPRALFSITVGASLAVAGALMQGVTRNPLADPSILGLTSGATCAVIIGIGWFGLAGTAYVPIFAAIGALAGAALVWGIASIIPGGSTPLTLILAGVAVTAFLGTIQSAAILLNQEVFSGFRVWLTGSMAMGDMDTYLWALPWFGAGLIAALLIARQVTALAMGEEAATGLGVNPARIKIIALLSVTALSAAAVAIAGPLGLVRLVIPHVVRLFIGWDYRLIVPFCAVVGGGYMLVVDTVARIVLAPAEISTGLITVVLGALVFIWLVRARL